MIFVPAQNKITAFLCAINKRRSGVIINTIPNKIKIKFNNNNNNVLIFFFFFCETNQFVSANAANVIELNGGKRGASSAVIKSSPFVSYDEEINSIFYLILQFKEIIKTYFKKQQ